MRLIFGSRRDDLFKAMQDREAYAFDWKNRVDSRAEQLRAFNNNLIQFTESIKHRISEMLEPELSNLGGVTIAINSDYQDCNQTHYSNWALNEFDDSDKSNTFWIYITYASRKRQNGASYSSKNGKLWGNYRGINWQFVVSFDYDSGEPVFDKKPQISADLIDSSDLDELKCTYELFAKMETVDWEALLTEVIQNSPKPEISVSQVEEFDRSKWDAQFTLHHLFRLVETDCWILLNNGLYIHPIQIFENAGTFTSYYLEWRKSKGDGTFDSEYINKQLENPELFTLNTIKIKEPIEVRTTQELISPREE